MQKLTPEQYMKLKIAEDLIGDVQVELAKEDDRRPRDQRTEEWRELYRVRCDFGRFVYNRRAEDWQTWAPLDLESKALYDSVVSRLQSVVSKAT